MAKNKKEYGYSGAGAAGVSYANLLKDVPTVKMTYQEAIRETLRQEMERDPLLFILGEEIGRYGGANGVSGDLWKQFGEERVRDTAIAENAILGTALGAAMTGCAAVPEIMFGDFLGVCLDQILNQISKIRYMSGGQVQVPLVIRTIMGGYIQAAAQHSQCLESIFVHMPGIKVVAPSTPADAMGLLRASIRDRNPVIFFEHKGMYKYTGQVPLDREYLLPLGKAFVIREGSDVTVVANSLMAHHALEAAEYLDGKGISVEVIDPMTLDPLDEDTILQSLKKTHHLVVVHEANLTGGYGGHIAAIAADKAFHDLQGPVKRVGARHVPIPFSKPLEDFVLPGVGDIVKAVQETLV